MIAPAARSTKTRHVLTLHCQQSRFWQEVREWAKIVEKVPGGKGRRVTPQGQRDLDSIAGQIGEK